MAVVVDLVFAGSKLDLYDAVMAEAGLVGVTDADRIPGLIAHYAFEENGELRIIDIWETADQWQAYATESIGAAAARAGVPIQPEVTISELYNSIR